MNEHICAPIKLYFQNRQQPDLAHGPQLAGPDLEETEIIKYKDDCTIQNDKYLRKTKTMKEKSN